MTRFWFTLDGCQNAWDSAAGSQRGERHPLRLHGPPCKKYPLPETAMKVPARPCIEFPHSRARRAATPPEPRPPPAAGSTDLPFPPVHGDPAKAQLLAGSSPRRGSSRAIGGYRPQPVPPLAHPRPQALAPPVCGTDPRSRAGALSLRSRGPHRDDSRTAIGPPPRRRPLRRGPVTAKRSRREMGPGSSSERRPLGVAALRDSRAKPRDAWCSSPA